MKLIFENWRHYLKEGGKPGLWANIHAKRKRGEPPAKPGDEDYPETLDIDEEYISEEYYEVDALDENEEYCPVCVQTMDEAKKKPCKPSKGKRFAKRVDGKCRSFGQAGQAKGGGDRKNVRTRPALIRYPERNGSVKVKNR